MQQLRSRCKCRSAKAVNNTKIQHLKKNSDAPAENRKLLLCILKKSPLRFENATQCEVAKVPDTSHILWLHNVPLPTEYPAQLHDFLSSSEAHRASSYLLRFFRYFSSSNIKILLSKYLNHNYFNRLKNLQSI